MVQPPAPHDGRELKTFCSRGPSGRDRFCLPFSLHGERPVRMVWGEATIINWEKSLKPARYRHPMKPSAPHDRPGSSKRWIPLVKSFSFLLSKPRLLAWSAGLTVGTILLTGVGFSLSTGLLDSLTASFLGEAPARESWLDWLTYSGWFIAKALFLIVSRVISFFIAFLVAYSLCSPFYAILSSAAEKLFLGNAFVDDEGFTLKTMLIDLWEGLKIASCGILVSVFALFLGFIPIFGQLSVIFVYTMFSTLMFIDYPASRRRWGLGAKLSWLRNHLRASIRIGILPAFVGMIPFFNIFFMALLFPLLTVHATLNFVAVERQAPPDQA